MQQFSNPKLNEIFKEVKPLIEDHVKMLDKISEDIRQIEQNLVNLNVSFTFEYKISKNEMLFHLIKTNIIH